MRPYRHLTWAIVISGACHGALVAALMAWMDHQLSPSSRRPRGDVFLTVAPVIGTTRLQIDDLPAAVDRNIPLQKSGEAPASQRAQLPNSPTPVPTAGSAATVSRDSEAPASPITQAEVPALHGRLTDRGSAVVYVLDRSGSMGRARKLEFAAAMIKASLKQLGPDMSFQIVAYDSGAAFADLGDGHQLASADADHIGRAEQWLNTLSAEGSSRHAEGLRAAMTMRPQRCILLTDDGDLSAAELKKIKQLNHSRAVIQAVVIGRDGPGCSRTLLELTEGRTQMISLPAPAQFNP